MNYDEILFLKKNRIRYNHLGVWNKIFSLEFDLEFHISDIIYSALSSYFSDCY